MERVHWLRAASLGLSLILGVGSYLYWRSTGDTVIFFAGMIGATLWILLADGWKQPLD